MLKKFNSTADRGFAVSRRKGLRQRLGGSKTQFVAPYIKVRGTAREENGDKYLVVIRYRDAISKTIKWLVIPRAQLINHEQLMRELMNVGYDVPADGERCQLLQRYLMSSSPRRRYQIVRRTGWCPGGGYITPDGRILGGNRRTIYIPTNPAGIGGPSVAGSLEGWIEGVARPALHSRLMMFGISTSLACLLIRLSGDESGVFHLFGLSTKGKSLTELAAQSVHASGCREDLLHWDATDTGLDELAAEHCDRLLVLDETGHLSTKDKEAVAKARKVAFKIAAGKGRLRSAFFGRAYNLCRWRVFVLSSGEEAISDLASAGGKPRPKGAQVRMIDIPAAQNQPHGVFESIPDGMTAAALAKQIENACRQHFGSPARAFVKRLLVDGDEVTKERIRKAKERFFKQAGVPDDSWERRFAERFALSYAAAAIGIRYRILPWKRAAGRRAIVSVYRAAREAIPEHRRMIDQACASIRSKLRRGTGLIDLRSVHRTKAKISRKADGFIKDDAQHGVFAAVKRKALRRWIGKALDLVAVGAYLREHHHLITNKRNLPTKQLLIPGVSGRRSYYCILESFWTTNKIGGGHPA